MVEEGKTGGQLYIDSTCLLLLLMKARAAKFEF